MPASGRPWRCASGSGSKGGEGIVDGAAEAVHHHLANLQGRYADGAHWWAANRSRPGASCQQAPNAADSDFNGGCQEATSRLAQFDRRRLAEPSYRVGWNSL